MSQNGEFMSQNGEFMSQNCEFISRNCEKKSQLPCFIFYSVAEMGFHTKDIYNRIKRYK